MERRSLLKMLVGGIAARRVADAGDSKKQTATDGSFSLGVLPAIEDVKAGVVFGLENSTGALVDDDWTEGERNQIRHMLSYGESGTKHMGFYRSSSSDE